MFFEIICHVFIGRVLTQNSPVMPQRTITLSEPHNTSIQSIPGKKIAISPLKTPSKVNSSHYSSITIERSPFFFGQDSVAYFQFQLHILSGMSWIMPAVGLIINHSLFVSAR